MTSVFDVTIVAECIVAGKRASLASATCGGKVIGWLSFRALSVGFSHTCGITTRGDVYCRRDVRYGQLGDGATQARLTPGLVPLPP